MRQVLRADDNRVRVLSPTTTFQVARRMLTASKTTADILPRGLYTVPALDILLQLYVAEGEAACLSTGDLSPAGVGTRTVIDRWVDVLVSLNLVDRRGDILALTTEGYAAVTDLVQSIFASQRSLD